MSDFTCPSEIQCFYPIGFQNTKTGPKVIKLFSCLTELSTKFQMLIKIKIPKSEEVSSFKSLRCGIYYANKC